MRLVRAAVLAREGKAAAATELLAGGAGPSCALMRAQLAAAAGDAQQVPWRAHTTCTQPINLAVLMDQRLCCPKLTIRRACAAW